MKILFLDDDNFRLRQAQQNFVGLEATLVTTAADAIAELKTKGPFDIVSLDHDLGGEQMVASGAETGYEVAKFIQELPRPLRPHNVILHTFNEPGARNMAACLTEIHTVRSHFGTPAYWRLFGA